MGSELFPGPSTEAQVFPEHPVGTLNCSAPSAPCKQRVAELLDGTEGRQRPDSSSPRVSLPKSRKPALCPHPGTHTASQLTPAPPVTASSQAACPQRSCGQDTRLGRPQDQPAVCLPGLSSASPLPTPSLSLRALLAHQMPCPCSGAQAGSGPTAHSSFISLTGVYSPRGRATKLVVRQHAPRPRP